MENIIREINLIVYKFIFMNDLNWILVLSLLYNVYDWNKY